MIRYWACHLLVAGFPLLFVLNSASAADESPARAQWEKYKPLVERTVFNRYRPPRTDRGPRPERPVIKPQRDIVLTGIVETDDDIVAFLENVATRAVTKVSVGDIVAGGKVTSITLDGIEYELEGTTVKVEPGKNLEGAERARTYSTYSSGSPRTTTTTTTTTTAKTEKPAAEPGADSADETESAESADSADSTQPAQPAMSEAEIRLRQRREQEVGR